MARHELTLGSLYFGEENSYDDGYWFDVLADGATFGASDPVQEVVKSLLADGDLTRISRFGNRQVQLRIAVNGSDLRAVARGEAALRRELGGPNLLTWLPPDDYASPTAFEVVTSSMSQTFDDLDELRKRRTFNVTLTCAPFARSADPSTVEAIAPPPETPTTVTLHDCDTTTGWTAIGTTYSVSGGQSTTAITVNDGGDFVWSSITGGWARVSMDVALGTGSLAATPYVLVEVTGSKSPQFALNGSATAPIMSTGVPGGRVQHVIDTDGAAVSSLRVTVDHFGPDSPFATATIFVHDISATDTLPNVTSHQLTRVIDPGGTERTPASLYVEAPDSTSSLLTTIVHTSPEDGSGYSPPLRRWRVSGNTVTADTSVLSGAYESLTPNPFAADVPISSIPHDGYIIAARVFSTITQTVELSWSVTTIVPGYPGYPGPLPADSGETTVTLFEDTWAVVGLGVTTLPTMRTTAMDASVRVIIGHPAGDSSISIDEGWIFRAGTDCALTIVDGIFRPLLRLESPSVGTPVPTALFGDANATIHPGGLLKAMGHHVLTPSGTAVFTATEGVTNPATSATFHRRWHSNAAE